MQPPDLTPQAPGDLIGDPAGRDLVQGRARHQVHGQQHRPAAGPDDLADTRHRHPGPLGHHAQQRLMLDSLEQRGRGPGITDAAQPQATPGPVQQVGVPLIRAGNLHEQGTPVAGGRPERPRSLRRAHRPGHLADRHPARTQRRRHPRRAHPPVRHPEHHQQPGPHAHPGRQRQHQLHRQQPPGDQPGHADQQQHSPARPAPRPAQPRRGGHRHRRQPRQHGRIRETRAGQPGTLTQPRRRGAAGPGQAGDPGHQGRRGREPARHRGQHPEPAVPQRGGQQHQGRRRDRHLDQAGQHPPRLSRGPHPGDRRRSGPEQGRQQHRDHDRNGQHQRPGDQPDHITRMPVPGRRQDTAPRPHLRTAAGQHYRGRISHGQ